MTTEDIGEVIDFRPVDEIDSEKIRQHSVIQKSKEFIASLKEYGRVGGELNRKVKVFSGSALLFGCKGTDFLGFAENVALNLKANIVRFRLSHALSEDTNIPLALRTLFGFAARNKPSLVFLEHLDLFAEESTNQAAVLKAEISRIDWVKEDTVFMGCTTRPRKVDTQILGTVDKTFIIQKTTTEDRIRLLEEVLAQRSDLDAKSVAEATEGWSYSDLKHLAGSLLLMDPSRRDERSPATVRAMIQAANILPVGRPQMAEAAFKQIEEGYSPQLQDLEEIYPDTLIDQLYLMAVGEDYVRTQEVVENLNKGMPLSTEEQQFLNKYPFLLQGESEDRLTRLLRAKKTYDRLSRVLGR